MGFEPFGSVLTYSCHKKPGPTLSDMAVKQEFNAIDAEFYLPAAAFFTAHRSLALTYDDITLATLYSEILPRDTQLDIQLAEGLNLNIPVIAADMDAAPPEPLRRTSWKRSIARCSEAPRTSSS